MSELKTQNIKETDIVLGKIANGLQSAASDHILGISKDIYDTNQQAYQGDINEYLLDKVVLEKPITAELNVGGILKGTQLDVGMTFTEFVEKLLTITFYGSIGEISSDGDVKIDAPKIEVRIKGEDGTWTQIDPETTVATVKENTTVKVSVINIPKSNLENFWACIEHGELGKDGEVFAYGWLKSIDGEVVPGEGDCGILTEPYTTGEDHLTIPEKTGIFNSLKKNDDGKIDMEFTIPASSSISEVVVGEIKVQSNSAKYQLKSAHDYEIAAVSSKQTSKPEKISDIPSDRKIIINKDDIIEGFEKSNSDYSTFKLKVEGWGKVPSKLETPGEIFINKPVITVYNRTEGEPIEFYEDQEVQLHPNHEIEVNVKLAEEPSSVENASAYLEKTSSTFQYGWERFKEGISDGILDKEQIKIAPNKNCYIGTTWSKTDDTLVISGTPNGAFKNMKISSDNKTITFITKVGEVASDFKVKAKSGEHTLYSDANYDVYALSSIQSSGESAQMNNSYSIANEQVLKTFGSAYSGESIFKFSPKSNKDGNIPGIQVLGNVSIGTPIISVYNVTRKEDIVFSDNEPVELNPNDTIKVKIELKNSEIEIPSLKAYYPKNNNYLKYGWQLWKGNAKFDEADEKGGDCYIDEIKYVKDEKIIDRLNIGAQNGVFEGIENISVDENNVFEFSTLANKASTLKVESIAATYNIYPNNNYTLYAKTELGDPSDKAKIELSPDNLLGKFENIKSSTASFSFTVLPNPWSYIPTIGYNGIVSIGEPIITVTKDDGTVIEFKNGSTPELDPGEKITVNVTIPQSNIKSISAYYQKSNDKLAYGWQLCDDEGEVDEADKNGKECKIGTRTELISADKLEISNTSGDFISIKDKVVNNNSIINFEIETSEKNLSSSFTVNAVPAVYGIYPDKNYTIYSKSELGNIDINREIDGDNTNTVEELPITKEIGKTKGTNSSATFAFTVKPDDWGDVPTISILNPNVRIAAPKIEVTRSGDPSILNSGVELNSGDSIDITITLNDSEIDQTTSIYYEPKYANDFKHGWKLFKGDDEISYSDKRTTCYAIESEAEKLGSDTHKLNTHTGIFGENLNQSNLDSKNVIELKNVKVGSENGKLSITSTPAKYKVKPSYNNYKIHALSRLKKHDDPHSEIPVGKDFPGTSQTAIFEYFVKVPQKELFYKIVKLNEIQTLLGNASSYNPLTENNLTNDLGFIKYIQDNADKTATISGGMCLILTKLPFENITVLNTNEDEMVLNDNDRNIGGYNLYSFNINGASTYNLKIK